MSEGAGSLGAVPGWRPPRRFGRVNWLGLWTLYRRDVWRVVKYWRESLLGPAASSVLFLAVFDLAGRGLAGTQPLLGGIPVLQFLAPGLIVFAICEQAFQTSSSSLIFDKLEGMIQDPTMAPLTAAERTAGYALSAATAGLMSGGVVGVAVLLFVDLPVARPDLLLLFAAGGALMHALMGVIVGLWAPRWEQFTAALSFVIVPLAYLSGVFYPIAALPEAAQAVVAFNPVSYVIDGFRAGHTGQAERPLLIGAAVVVAVNAALAALVQRLFARGYRLKP